MTCQVCLSVEATMHVTERLPLGRFREGHYCGSCWAAKELGLSPDQVWPRPKLALKSILIVIIGFALFNSLAVWMVRNRPTYHLPEELMRQTISALLMVNSCIGIIILYIALSAHWMRELIWHRRTGNVRPMPSAKAMSRNRDLLGIHYRG